MSITCGSGPPGSPSTGRTALAPEWRTISSSPTEPSGKRTVSIPRSTTGPLCTGRRETIPAPAGLCMSLMSPCGKKMGVARADLNPFGRPLTQS